MSLSTGKTEADSQKAQGGDPAKPRRLVFMGTPEFALPGLKALLAAPEFEVVGVFTAPDKPVGRRQIPTPSAVKIAAQRAGLKIFQPEKIRPETETIRTLAPDLIVVIAYGHIIPPDILSLPTYGCLNVHGSLLPRYRGAACLNAPILNGDDKTGITIMKMDAGLDTGPILRQAEMKLDGRETLTSLHDRLAKLSAEILVPTIRAYVAGEIEPRAQDNTKASYVKMLKKEDGLIDWRKPAAAIERMVRAYNPWPGAYFTSRGKIIKIMEVEPKILKTGSGTKESGNNAPGAPKISEPGAPKAGEMFLARGKLAVQCGADALVISRLQPAGKKIMTAKEFISGYKI